MQIRHADQGEETSAAIRGGDREFKTLLVGDENSPDNFRLVLARQSGKVVAPRHKHNFDQIRMCLSGDGQNYGPDRWIRPGEIVYFPEGVPYGPEDSDCTAARRHAPVRRRERQRISQLAPHQAGHGGPEAVRHVREGRLLSQRRRARPAPQPGQLRGGLGARQSAQARISEAALRRADHDAAAEFRLAGERAARPFGQGAGLFHRAPRGDFTAQARSRRACANCTATRSPGRIRDRRRRPRGRRRASAALGLPAGPARKRRRSSRRPAWKFC